MLLLLLGVGCYSLVFFCAPLRVYLSEFAFDSCTFVFISISSLGELHSVSFNVVAAAADVFCYFTVCACAIVMCYVIPFLVWNNDANNANAILVALNYLWFYMESRPLSVSLLARSALVESKSYRKQQHIRFGMLSVHKIFLFYCVQSRWIVQNGKRRQKAEEGEKNETGLSCKLHIFAVPPISLKIRRNRTDPRSSDSHGIRQIRVAP